MDILDDLCGYDIWNIGIIHRSIRRLEDLADLSDAVWLPPHPDPLSYVADPFPCVINGRQVLLVEEYSHRRGRRGRIAVISTDMLTGWLSCERVIDERLHQSYPCVVQFQEQVYCIPESYQAGQCRAYRLTGDGSFLFERVLIDGVAILDPTVFFHEGYWWLFCTDHKRGNHSYLMAFYATAFEGPWIPHPLNPLKQTNAGARPAGPPFYLHGRLYRPAQDCSRTYGSAVIVHEVLVLTPDAFDEQPVLRISPDPDGRYPDGLHHLVIEKDRVIIDGKQRRFSWTFTLQQWL